MGRNGKLLFISIFFLFVNTIVFAQEALFEMEEEQAEEETNCIPESLTVAYDIYANLEDAQVRQWYSFGSEHYKNKNYVSALPYLWKVFLNDSAKRGSLSIGKIADAYFQQKYIDSTLIACYRGFEVFPDHQKLHYFAGFLQKQLGKSLCAVPHYEALVSENPKNVAYLSTLAFLYYKVEEYQKAIDTQKKVVELNPNDGTAQETLANYISASGESPMEAWKKAWQKDNKNLEAARNYARYAIDEGKYKEALEPLAKAISTDAINEDYKYRAIAYENLGQFSNAIKDLNLWLKRDTDNADIMLSIAVNYSALKQFKTANNWIYQAIRKKPSYGKPYIVRGELYEAMVLACQEQRGGKVKLEDKLVYEEAIKVYGQARKDLAYKSKASTKINNLKPFVRTKEEVFMEPNAKVKSSCYSFLVGSSGS